MIEIYMCKISSRNLISQNSILLNYVSEHKKKKYSLHHNLKSASQSLIGEILLRISISSISNIQDKYVVFSKNQHNKPLLEYPSGYFVNISHSGDWVVSAICRKPVGIDIERFKNVDYKNAQSFFSNKEFSILMNKDESERLDYFFELWTLKESYVKAIGKGLNYPFNKFSITYDGNDFIINDELRQDSASFQQFIVDEGHIMSLCAFSSMTSTVKEFSLHQLEYLVLHLNSPGSLNKEIKMLDIPEHIYDGGGKFSLCY